MIPGNSNAFNNRKHIPPPFKGLFLQSDPGKNPATLPRAHSELNDGELASSKASSAPTPSELIHTDMQRLENSPFRRPIHWCLLKSQVLMWARTLPVGLEGVN